MFIRMHQKNLIRMDGEGKLDSVFWVHPQSKVSYEEFNDVIQDAICDYRWSQPSWPIHLVWFSTYISKDTETLVMPKIIRRYCIWHIMCKLLNKFKGLMEQFHKARKEFRSLIYDILTKLMFETNWNQFVAKYRLETNQWLIKVYSEREQWVPMYLNHIFWVGILSNQRSESIHAFFYGYLRSTSTLK
ncbi:hypothetical protein M9H77_35260 [Catharanthus roseus]|uniref:Uncharacterized protein n=1 Tax=Catharanthus roseus TaxID=4058 RepID=A0ACB9ZS66_CATRO|nr:hypothetical protein M9H77_35260 [Catharanthus roseus]